MLRSGILGATALSLSLAVAVPALAQQAPRGQASAHVSGGAAVRASTGNVGGARMGSAPRANFQGAQTSVGASNFAARSSAQFAQPRGSAQVAQQGAFRGGEFRDGRGDRRFARNAGIAAGVAVGSALAFGGYGYDPYYYGNSYAYDVDSGYYDPGYAVAYDQPTVAVEESVAPVGIDPSYCAQRYRSYDPASGTYLGFDGLRHPCP
jgi:BA14K-like protein